ncbi:MAG: sugar ABC transporter permease [Propionibacteriaceae bacterium]|nr:sugar ABC transporter permease [Propionibacteriaceae bacterium]
MKTLKHLTPYLLLVPAVAFVLLFSGYPLVNQFILSFHDFGLAQQFGAPAEWIGLSNYTKVLSDPYFWSVLGRSLAFCAWTAGWTMLLALGLALLMREASPWARTLLNVSFIVVWAMPMLAALTVWQWLVDPHLGLFNFVLATLGLEQFTGFSWLASSPWTFHLVASTIIIWASMPLAAISIYAALTQVDDALLEAAQIDGASYWKRLRHVVYPIISPVVALIGILQIIWDLRVFTQIHVLQQSGGISTETNLLGTYVYQVGISQSKYGIASAIATVILLITVVITAKYIHMLYTKGDD